MNQTWIYIILAVIVVLFLSGIRIVRPTHRGLTERLGKYVRFAKPGFHWIFPVIEKMYQINITEQMVEEALKLNAKVVVPAGSDLVNIMGEMAGILPINNKKNLYEGEK